MIATAKDRTTKDRWSRELDSFGSSAGNVIEHDSRLPTHDEIEIRAFEIYVRNGSQEGHREEHWLEAERELMEELHNEQSVSGATGKGSL